MDKPIGIFDSGIGGLTVLKEIHRVLPGEDLIYFGDTARVPYGTKSRETVTRYSMQIVEFLLSLDVKMIVIACNSASALALETLEKKVAVPVVGVIEPGAAQAVWVTRGGRIGVIGTRATIGSGAYEKEIRALRSDAHVMSRACPIFVSLVEEGWTEHAATRLIAKEYLAPLREEEVDTLVLGCTHYPLLAPLISDIMGEGVAIVDSASSCAGAVAELLEEGDTVGTRGEGGRITYYVSDMSARFSELGERFLGRRVDDVCEHQFDGG